MLHAAAIGYWLLLSIAPLLIVTVGLASQIFSRRLVEWQIFTQIERTLGPSVALAVGNVLLETRDYVPSGVTTGLTVLFLFYSASSIFLQLQSSLDAMWGIGLRAESVRQSLIFILKNALCGRAGRARGRLPAAGIDRSRGDLGRDPRPIPGTHLHVYGSHHGCPARLDVAFSLHLPFRHYLQGLAPRHDSLARCAARRGTDRAPLLAGWVLDYHLPECQPPGLVLRRGRIGHCLYALGLLFGMDYTVRGEVHAGLHPGVWGADPAVRLRHLRVATGGGNGRPCAHRRETHAGRR